MSLYSDRRYLCNALPGPLGKNFCQLDLVVAASILLHQFLSGKCRIQYDRLLWFIAAGLAATCSLLLNFERASVTSYSLFLALCSLLTLSRPSNPDQYKSTLQAFQFLVLLLSCSRSGAIRCTVCD